MSAIPAIMALLLFGSFTAALCEGQSAGNRDSVPGGGGRQVRLDIEIKAEKWGGDIVGCLRPALHATGVDWSAEYLRGWLGSAFTFSMKEDGGHLEQADNYQWSYFYEMLDFLEHERISASLRGNDPVSPEEHARAKAEAWEKVRGAIDDGYPAIVWQAMTKETWESGRHDIPWLWSLIVGYDVEAESYTVHHAGQGEFTIRWDAFGHADPANWFCVMIFGPQTGAFDALGANRRAIERAIESSQGMHPGVKAPAHGLAAWEMWVEAFREGTVSVQEISHHADFLIDSRTSAAIYLTEIELHFPESAHAHLREAAEWYDEVVDAVGDLRDLSTGGAPDLQEGAKILSRALESERAALASLQRVLEAK